MSDTGIAGVPARKPARPVLVTPSSAAGGRLSPHAGETPALPAPIFVTGTDTDVGKTFVATALLRLARVRGLRCVAVKPVAAGCAWRDGELVNEDALALLAASESGQRYRAVNPVALEPAIAPHIAAAEVGATLRVADLAARCRETLAAEHDFALIEGAGGWLVPLGDGAASDGATDDGATLAELCAALAARPLLVVGMKLGCLNHALLTAAAIAAAGLELAGWVANSPGPPMPRLEANVATLRARLDAPCLGVVPHCDPAEAPRHLNIEPLLATA